jgi:hypothetical protein
MSPKQASLKNLKNVHQNQPAFSICPSGEEFPLPKDEDYASEFKRVEKLVKEQRLKNREIVVVMGVGFVGSVMAGVVADSVDPASGQPTKFVIGMQRPSIRSFWKIPYLNRGIAPVEAEDPEVAPLIQRCVLEKKTLLAHSFERVMPGRNYVASIRDFWRVCSGINDTARERVTKFLSDVINVDK